MEKDFEEEFDVDEDDPDVYTEEGREESIEEDEIDELEEGFMQGYEEGENLAKCALCKKVLTNNFFEREINDKLYRFCSEEHAEVFAKKKED